MNTSDLDRSPTQMAIALSIAPQGDGSVGCERQIALNGQPAVTQVFYGQTANHAIAIALEALAEQYRKAADAAEPGDWEAVVRSPAGEVIPQRFHVILHYERVAEDVSRFEAMHNTIMGNTVVENATIAVIPVATSLPIEPIVRPWF
ncbi:hypothetical protein [Trichothermofontia sp.]